MNEIEKLYKNAGIGKIGNKKCTPAEFLDCQNYCFISENNKCDKYSYGYPPFTAEKQIKLLEFNYKYSRVPDIAYIIELEKYDCPHYDNYGAFDTFQEALCADINYHWDYFTEEEKQQVKGILNE